MAFWESGSPGNRGIVMDVLSGDLLSMGVEKPTFWIQNLLPSAREEVIRLATCWRQTMGPETTLSRDQKPSTNLSPRNSRR